MTNKEWLDYLAHNAPDELAAWFDAEHTESPTSETMQQIGQVIESTVKRGVYGDTEPENADSREKLEADVFKAAEDMEMFYNGERFIDTRKIFCWLDRQAAITQHEITERWAEHLHPIEHKCGDLRRKVDELEAERDNLKANNQQLHTLAGEQAATIDELTAKLECCQNRLGFYRSKLGTCADLSEEIRNVAMGITDEGMA